MTSLINSIPAKTPQTQSTQKKSESVFSNIKNPYPQITKYDYIPARPLSPVRTIPKYTRPVAASGEIINENIWQSAVSTVKSYGEYAKNFYNAAFKGEGNDYKVGKINDLSIRAGSLGIASILATTKFFPFAKGMEFVGLGTWFASMAVWPHVIGAPIKALTGVDINQKYKDSYGRRKYVFEDNQYRPMDLYRHLDRKGKALTEKEYYRKYQYDYVYLDKLADKMKISKDRKNRNEETMEKMGQIAVQGRALSMLTAGVMTPVLSSVVADALQTPFKNIIEETRILKHHNELDKLDRLIKALDQNEDYKDRKTVTKLQEVMSGLKISIKEDTLAEYKALIGEMTPAKNGQQREYKEVLSPEEYNKFKSFLKERLQGTLLEEPVERYIKNELKINQPKITLDKNLQEKIKEITVSTIKEYVTGLDEEVAELIPDSIKKYQGLSEEEFLSAVKKSVTNGESCVSDYKNAKQIQINNQDIPSLKNSVVRAIDKFLLSTDVNENAVDAISEEINKNINKFLESQKHHIIVKNDKFNLLELLRFVETDKALRKQIEKYEKATIANISESVTANTWEKIPVQYLNVLGFNKNEIAQLATMDSSQASKIVCKKFENIVKDEKQYAEVTTELSRIAAKAIEKEEHAVRTLIGTMNKNGILPKVKDLMASLASYNFGSQMERDINQNYRNLIKNVQFKLRNTTDSFIRPIKALDTFKHIEKEVELILGHNQQQFEQALKNPNYYMFTNMNFEEAKASLIAFIKDIVLDKNDINNWTTKMEHDIPGGKKGMKHSLELIQKIADIVNGPIHRDTITNVDSFSQMTVKTYFKDKKYKNAANKFLDNLKSKLEKHIIEKLKLNEISDSKLNMSERINLNNSIMRFRFLNIERKLAKAADDSCYMKDYYPSEKLIRKICEGDKDASLLYLMEGWLSERREELSLDDIKGIKNLITTVKDQKSKIELGSKKSNTIFRQFDFAAADKEIAEMSGKNITDFLVSAAENYRSRNKWMKVAYGLLAGTTLLTAFVISRIGKSNYFNPPEAKKGAGN